MTLAAIDPERILTVPAAAIRLGVGKRTLYAWIRRGHLRLLPTPSGTFIVDYDDVLDADLAVRGRDRSGRTATRNYVAG